MRELRLSFARTLETWLLTVDSVMNADAAMSPLLKPRAASRNTSFSRAVSAEIAASFAGHGRDGDRSWMNATDVLGAITDVPARTVRMDANRNSGVASFMRNLAAPALMAPSTAVSRWRVVSGEDDDAGRRGVGQNLMTVVEALFAPRPVLYVDPALREGLDTAGLLCRDKSCRRGEVAMVAATA
jgi:hypothetical protein